MCCSCSKCLSIPLNLAACIVYRGWQCFQSRPRCKRQRGGSCRSRLASLHVPQRLSNLGPGGQFDLDHPLSKYFNRSGQLCPSEWTAQWVGSTKLVLAINNLARHSQQLVGSFACALLLCQWHVQDIGQAIYASRSRLVRRISATTSLWQRCAQQNEGGQDKIGEYNVHLAGTEASRWHHPRYRVQVVLPMAEDQRGGFKEVLIHVAWQTVWDKSLRRLLTVADITTQGKKGISS